MVYKNVWLYFHLWNSVLYLEYTSGLDTSVTNPTNYLESNTRIPPEPANATHTVHRSGNQRDLMVVLPVMQGHADVSDPRLQFWYTKSPVTVVIQDDNEGAQKSMAKVKVPNSNSTGSKSNSKKQHQTQKYNDAYYPTQPKDEQHDRQTFAPITEAWLKRQTEWKSQNPKSDTPNLTSVPTQQYSIQGFDIPDTASLSTAKYDPLSFKLENTEASGGSAKVEIVSAESKWKDLHAKLKNKTRVDLDKSTPKPIVLPSSTRFQYYTDFMPIESHPKLSPSLPPTPFRTHKPFPELNFPAETTTPKNSLQMYELMKHLSLKPVRMPDADNMDELFSPDREYFNVLADFSVPSDGMFQDRTKSRPTFAFDTTQPWIPNSRSQTESYNLPTRSETQSTVPSTAATTLEKSPLPESPTTDFATSTDRLTSDFKLMLVALGILKDNETTTTTTESNELWRDPESFTIDPHSYVKFKKLPTEPEKTPIRQDMQTLLDSFGLLPKTNEVDNSVLTRVTRQSKLVLLDEIGTSGPNVHDMFIKVKMASENSTLNFTVKNETRSTPHPPLQAGLNYTTSKPIKFFKDFESSHKSLPDPLSAEEQQPQAKKIIKRQQPLGFAFSDHQPNPLSTGRETTKNQTKQLLGLKFSDQKSPKFSEKRRVKDTRKKRKRQQLLGFAFADRLRTPNTTPADIQTTKTPTTTIQTTTTSTTTGTAIKRDSNTAPLEDLAASFGGGETATDDPADDQPTPKPNGLYFFVDWNTFLNVADGDKNPIRVRFSPRVGNARNFVPIVLP